MPTRFADFFLLNIINLLFSIFTASTLIKSALTFHVCHCNNFSIDLLTLLKVRVCFFFFYFNVNLLKTSQEIPIDCCLKFRISVVTLPNQALCKFAVSNFCYSLFAISLLSYNLPLPAFKQPLPFTCNVFFPTFTLLKFIYSSLAFQTD